MKNILETFEYCINMYNEVIFLNYNLLSVGKLNINSKIKKQGIGVVKTSLIDLSNNFVITNQDHSINSLVSLNGIRIILRVNYKNTKKDI